VEKNTAHGLGLVCKVMISVMTLSTTKTMILPL